MERGNLRRLPDEWTADDEALLEAIDEATATPIEITRRLAQEWFAGVKAVLDELEEREGRGAGAGDGELPQAFIDGLASTPSSRLR